jgi:hypothetical protein
MELLAVGLDVERGRRAAPKCGGPAGRFGICFRNRVAGRPPLFSGFSDSGSDSGTE